MGFTEAVTVFMADSEPPFRRSERRVYFPTTILAKAVAVKLAVPGDPGFGHAIAQQDFSKRRMIGQLQQAFPHRITRPGLPQMRSITLFSAIDWESHLIRASLPKEKRSIMSGTAIFQR